MKKFLSLAFVSVVVSAGIISAFAQQGKKARIQYKMVRWGGNDNEYSTDISFGAGSVFLSGKTLSFGAGGWDAYILRYDQQGNLIWARTWGRGRDDIAYGVAADSSGNSYLVGTTYSFGKQMEAFVVKFSPQGLIEWERVFGGYGDDVAIDAIVSGGYIYVVGKTKALMKGRNPWDVFLKEIIPQKLAGSTWDAFVVKFDPQGNPVWQGVWDNGFSEIANCVASDGGKEIYVVGTTGRHMEQTKVFLLNIDSSGKLKWQTTYMTSSNDEGNAVAVKGKDVYVVGTRGKIGYKTDAFLFKYNRNRGGLLWQKVWNGNKVDNGNGLSIDPRGNLFVVGETRSFNAKSWDVSLIKFDPNGNPQWYKKFGGGGGDWANELVAPSADTVFIAGATINLESDSHWSDMEQVFIDIPSVVVDAEGKFSLAVKQGNTWKREVYTVNGVQQSSETNALLPVRTVKAVLGFPASGGTNYMFACNALLLKAVTK